MLTFSLFHYLTGLQSFRKPPWILISADHLFATHGFAHTSMPAIAKRSGITPGAIYRHFESKAQLLVEVVRYALATLPHVPFAPFWD